MSMQTPLENNSFVCPDCGANEMTIQYVDDSFEYGGGKEVVTLKVTIPVHVCGKCASEFNSEEGDRIRHDAICAYLGGRAT